MLDSKINNISRYFKIKNNEIIFTSGASESNNFVIKGIYESHNIQKIITTKLEHSSILKPIAYLQKKGVEVIFCPLKNGVVDLDELKNLIDDKNTLVTITSVDSELGIKQPISEIGEFLSDKENVIFHTDATQALGKIDVDLKNVDLASFSGHKIYCLKGIGGLIKKENIKITPLIHGGKSTTFFRSGTPQNELIALMSDAFDLLIPNVSKYYSHVNKLKEYLINELNKLENIHINSNNNSIPHILNFSVVGKNSEDIKDYFSNNNIFISTKTACSTEGEISTAVKEVTGEENYAKSSVRVSLSYKTTMDEIISFI